MYAAYTLCVCCPARICTLKVVFSYYLCLQLEVSRPPRTVHVSRMEAMAEEAEEV